MQPSVRAQAWTARGGAVALGVGALIALGAPKLFGPSGLSLSYLVLYFLCLTAAWKDRKSTRLNSSHVSESRMPSSA